jgi:hypothetical protein
LITRIRRTIEPFDIAGLNDRSDETGIRQMRGIFWRLPEGLRHGIGGQELLRRSGFFKP